MPQQTIRECLEAHVNMSAALKRCVRRRSVMQRALNLPYSAHVGMQRTRLVQRARGRRRGHRVVHRRSKDSAYAQYAVDHAYVPLSRLAVVRLKYQEYP